ncbi:MAG: SDR family NAD(P)-dependent oxidoreductase [Planctomycetota bacterium]|nr:SDR family NAD(P)-dependent oxidoreductase [Planctomycetota bacterium]
MPLSNRHFVITGAGTGIGRAIAHRLDAGGARLSLFGRRLSALEETAESLTGTPHMASLDIANRQHVQTAFAEAVRVHGALNGLIANAGVGGSNSPEDPDGDRFDELIDINLRGTYHSLRAAQANLASSDLGPRHMVVISSILARIGVPGYSGYCASKTALLGLVRSMAMELAPEKILVNAICPGWVNTEMAWDGIDGMAGALGIEREEAHTMAMNDVPTGRMGEPKEVAGLVAYLLSEDANGTTGSAIDINGGAYMA